jgi:hypothetical protein
MINRKVFCVGFHKVFYRKKDKAKNDRLVKSLVVPKL